MYTLTHTHSKLKLPHTAPHTLLEEIANGLMAANVDERRQLVVRALRTPLAHNVVVFHPLVKRVERAVGPTHNVGTHL